LAQGQDEARNLQGTLSQKSMPVYLLHMFTSLQWRN